MNIGYYKKGLMTCLSVATAISVPFGKVDRSVTVKLHSSPHPLDSKTLPSEACENETKELSRLMDREFCLVLCSSSSSAS
ncbi:hypothetical protein SO802_033755 [Lithocarpus litseifolius]|uniref:Uncharacterized protein n=1 Tax=Lithocarpus litseifolius TaxID=425828 RepID=A0AAW2BDY0_9ROSI